MSSKATLEYLQKMGAKVDPAALRPPDISALVTPSGNPCAWEDKTGRPVPPDLEFYRVEVNPGPQGPVQAEQVVRAKQQEGFAKLDGEHGFRMRGCQTPGAEIVMVRTKEVSEAFRRAEIMRQKRAKSQRPVKTYAPPEGTVGGHVGWQDAQQIDVKVRRPSAGADGEIPPPPGFES